MFHWKKNFRGAHFYMFGYPSEGQALEMVKGLVAPQMDAIRTAKSLSEASALFNAWTERTAEIAALPETERSIQANNQLAHSLKAMMPDADISEFMFMNPDTKFNLEINMQKMFLFNRHPNLALAKTLMFALLEHPRGPKFGYSIYQDNIKFLKTHGLN